jgi:hypothetical protein
VATSDRDDVRLLRFLTVDVPVEHDGSAPPIASRRATSSANTTDRCLPPVHPRAIVRYDFPSASYPGRTRSHRASSRSRSMIVAGWLSTYSRRERRGPKAAGGRLASGGSGGTGSRGRCPRRAAPRACSRRRRPRSHLLVPVPEHLGHACPQLVHVELAGVEDHVRPVPDRPEPVPLVGDGVLDVATPEGVTPAGSLESPHENVIGGVEVDDPHPVALRLQVVEAASASVKFAPPPRPTRGRPGPGRAPVRPRRLRPRREATVACCRSRTNRSPRAAAAVVERPAPDIPVMSR